MAELRMSDQSIAKARHSRSQGVFVVEAALGLPIVVRVAGLEGVEGAPPLGAIRPPRVNAIRLSPRPEESATATLMADMNHREPC